MPYDDDEGEIRIGLTEVMLGIAVAVIVAPGVIWWIGAAIGVFQTTLGAGR